MDMCDILLVMSRPGEAIFNPAPRRPMLTRADALFLGQLTGVGVALPNSPHLRVPAQHVEDITSQAMRGEIERLATAADRIASLRDVSFGGLNHAQLRPSANQPPLRMFLAPVAIPGAEPVITIKESAYYVFANTALTYALGCTPTERVKEGCFSAPAVYAVTRRYERIDEVKTLSNTGEKVTIPGVRAPGAIVVQHEHGHDLGVRAADHPPSRAWVPRDSLQSYRGMTLEAAEFWHLPMPDSDWVDFSSDPVYPYFSTEELRDAFMQGYTEG